MSVLWRLVAGRPPIVCYSFCLQKSALFSEKFFSKRDLVVEEMEETTAKLDVVRQNGLENIFYFVFYELFIVKLKG